MIRIHLLLQVGLIILIVSGCASVVRLHPIDKIDIIQMQKGVPYISEKDGWFLSDYYLKQVVKTKVEK